MDLLSLHDIEAEARSRLPSPVFHLFASGADDGRTVEENTKAFCDLSFVPRVLTGATGDLRTQLLGETLSLPVVLSPTGFHKLAHPEGELATVRAAARFGTLMMVSQAATVSLESIAEAARGVANRPSLWFQLYIQPDRQQTLGLIRRAEEAGYGAIVITVDSPVLGNREENRRQGMPDLPNGLHCENMRDPESGEVRNIAFLPELSWDHIHWAREQSSLPIVLKGVMAPEDAQLALEVGAAAVIVSNHGGRQLDGTLPTIRAIGAIRKRTRGRLPLLLDGGIRRGTDVLKALALGASAVGVGRPVLWGLSVGGEEGVYRVLEILQEETRRAMILCGCASVQDASPALVEGGTVWK